MDYSYWKLLHIIGAILFLGNITTGLFWAAFAHRQRDLRLVSSTFRGIIQSDRWFTVPGVFALLAGGFGSAISGNIPVLRTGWVFWAIVLFSVSGIVFGLFVAPLQKQIQDFAERQPESPENWENYCGLYRRWSLWGLISWLTPVVAVVIMVLKPPIPGL